MWLGVIMSVGRSKTVGVGGGMAVVGYVSVYSGVCGGEGGKRRRRKDEE